jgi:hypothetical protein
MIHPLFEPDTHVALGGNSQQALVTSIQQAAEQLVIRLAAGVGRRLKIDSQRSSLPTHVGSAGNARL